MVGGPLNHTKMDQTFRQLGELLLGSIPTVIFFLLTYGFYRLLLHKPLERVLHERHERTEGAAERARAAVAAAEAKTAEYEQRLSQAKLAIFQAQDARRQQALEARTAVVAAAREEASRMVAEARTQIEKDKQVAQAFLQGEAERLAAMVMNTILKPVAAARSQSPAGGAR